MRAVAPPDPRAVSRLPHGSTGIAVDCLDARDQRVVRQLRAAHAANQGRAGEEVRPVAAREASAAFVRYARELRRDCEAAAEDSPIVTHAEARTLRAVDCMRVGLLGEAWKVLSEICAPGRTGAAMLALEAVAAATGPAGPSGDA
jgi:hypothetical protein